VALVPTTDLTRMREGVKRFASGFTPGQKAVTVAAVLGAVILGALYMTMSGKPTYSVLFSNLQPSDASAITQQLSGDHVPYQLENGGDTILVPENDVSQARLTAAAAGLPSQSTVGLSLLTKTGITTSQLAQQADYLQAIQGELEQTIDSISGVSSSQVNVAEAANQTLALSTTKPSGASVLVDLGQGHSLSQGEVQAIVHLVASSVPGLDASQVTVADNSGALLAGPGVNSGGSAQNSQTSSYDSSVQAKVESYLQSVFGPGNADVEVNAVLNFNKEKTSTHQLVPSTKSALTSFCTSTKTSKTKYAGVGTPSGGTAGSVTITGGSSQNGTYTQTVTTKSCETGTETSTITLAPGTVTSQSIAVLVNSKAVHGGMNMSAIKSGVAAAAGLQPSRGDVLSFTEAPFSTAAAKQAAQAAAAATASSKKAQMGTMEKDGAAALLVGALLFLVWRSARKRRRSATADAMVEAAAPAGMLPAYAPYEIEEYPTGEIPRIASSPNQRVTPEVEQFIDEQPAEVATVLRGWLREGSPAERISSDA
jgi:flagellar M-ring protein FliF